MGRPGHRADPSPQHRVGEEDSAARRPLRRGCVGIGLWLLSITLFASVVTSTAAEDSSRLPIKILTFNIMWEEDGVRAGNLSLPVWAERKAQVAQLIREADADVVGFQEASPEQQAGLRGRLPDYTLVHHEATNNTNPVLFRSARFRRLDSGAFVLNTTPEREGTNIGVRSSTWVQLEDRTSGEHLWFYSLHLDHRSTGPTRQISAVRLVERIVAHDGAVVVTGDFNTSENSPEMLFLYGKVELENDSGEQVTNSRPLVTAYKFVHPEDSRRVIDHVLADHRLHIRDAGRISSGQASDHDVFWALFSIK